MKLKKYFEMNDENIDIDELGQDDVVETLLSTLRKMLKNSNFEKTYVFTDDDGCINIQFVLNKTEKFSSVMKAMNFLKKLETDILIQYEAEFDLWETKESDPLLTGKFYYDESVPGEYTDDEYNDDDTPF